MTKARALSQVLQAERQALLVGDFAALDTIERDKTAALDALRVAGALPQALRELAGDIDRNQTLLAAAKRGVEAVQDRLAQVKQARAGFNAYGPKGEAVHVGPAAGQHHRKA